MAPQFLGEDFPVDVETFFEDLKAIDEPFSKILKEHIHIVADASASDEKTARATFNSAVSQAILDSVSQEDLD